MIASGGHNVLGDSSCAAPVSNDKAGVADFLLTPLGNNGGPAPTMVPLTGSAAIGQGGTNCPATDERGVSRPQGAACTAGAVEAGQGVLGGGERRRHLLLRRGRLLRLHGWQAR